MSLFDLTPVWQSCNIDAKVILGIVMVRRDLAPVALDHTEVGEELPIDGRNCEKGDTEGNGEGHCGGGNLP